ncbi:MAG: FAD-dependent oxidoreductase [Actinomycetota bacterium]|nr:FAD-dependent oxidoreductase [Actinomycetota bacterium]
MTRRVVVVGSSVGGLRTAQALRQEGWSGEVVLVGAETELPYDKPPLSKEFLTGRAGRDDLLLLDRAQAAADGIELRLGCPATALDVEGRRLRLADGSALAYGALVVATGARARTAPFRPEQVHVVRTLADTERLRSALAGGGPVVVLGGALIGGEVASACRALGLDVTLVDPERVPMVRVVGAEVGALLVDLHERAGVVCRLGVGVAEVAGQQGDLRVRLTDGGELRAATVVAGIGAEPEDGWLAGSGVLLDDGVVCDASGRTSAPDVWAVGDVARWQVPGQQRAVRVEHWTSAVEQAECVAHGIAAPHDLRVHEPSAYVWTDQHGWRVQVLGRPEEAAERVVVGDPGAGRFAEVSSRDGHVVTGAVVVNWPRALSTLRRVRLGSAPLGPTTDALRALSVPRAGPRGA